MTLEVHYKSSFCEELKSKIICKHSFTFIPLSGGWTYFFLSKWSRSSPWGNSEYFQNLIFVRVFLAIHCTRWSFSEFLFCKINKPHLERISEIEKIIVAHQKEPVADLQLSVWELILTNNIFLRNIVRLFKHIDVFGAHTHSNTHSALQPLGL